MEAAESIVVNDGLAERDGVEPAVQVTPYDGLAGSPVQPLNRPFGSKLAPASTSSAVTP